VRNEDSTLHFPEHVFNESTKELHESFNRVNALISDIKIKNEHRERFFLEFMKHSTTGLMAVDEKGYIEIVNDAALKLLNTRILINIARLEQINPILYDAIISVKPNQSKTIKILIKDEFHYVLIKMVKLTFSNRVFNLYSLGDIKSELDEKEMETWQKLIRILTHEIMNSIAPISSISDTMLRYFKKEEPLDAKELGNVAQGLDVINERSKGLLHFVDNYRKLTKIPKPVFESIEVPDWMESIQMLFNERVTRDQINFTVQNEFKGKSFLGDQKLLTQVVINLLNNAADAVKQNSEKKIRIEVSGTDTNGVSLKFIDNGPGISQENLDQIFIPFFTTKENGSGIGLSLSRQIMKLHGGQLNARSIMGKETVFEMRI
jgi:nitrogen fixation/metabolism regulation signal transduction histidine kinase